MLNSVKDFLDMAEAEYQFLLTDGAPLAEAVPRIASGRTKLGLLLIDARAQANQQSQGTTAITLTYDQTKKATIPTANVVRRWVLLISTDSNVQQALKLPPTEMEAGPDKDYRDYLGVLNAAALLITDVQGKEIGYNDTVRTGLATQLDTLNTTTGGTRQQQGKQKAAGTLLGPAVSAVRDWLDLELTPLIDGQALTPALANLVARYHVLHRIKHTVGPRKPKALTGHTHFDVPVVVIRRDKVNIPAATLRNKSGKGVALCYYLADTPDAPPTPGFGRTVRYREEAYLADLSILGPNPNAPYLLVMQLNEGGEGTYRLEYTPTGSK